jgi:hypothetical protein
MPNYVTFTVGDVDLLLDPGMYDAGAVVRLESAALSAGPYASEGTAALTSGTDFYIIYDTDGTTSTFYRTRYENAGGTVTSDYSAPFQVGGADTTYASLSTFRAYVRNQSTILTDVDADLELLALNAAARAIDRHCGRSFQLATTATARTFTAGFSTGAWGGLGRRFAVDIDDVTDLTGMVVKFDTTGNGDYTNTVTTYRATPTNASAKGQPYTSLLFDLGTIPPFWEEGVEVTAMWGWSVIPAAITTANLIQASRFLKRRDSPFGVAGSPELGNELRLLAKVDPDVAVMLSAYKLDWGVQ